MRDHRSNQWFSFLRQRLVVPIFLFFFSFTLATSCVDREILYPEPKVLVTTRLKPMGYCIQVGAFENLDNAIRLMDGLNRRGMDAYYFKHASGLFKVRFGNYTSESSAREAAARLQSNNTIDVYFIIRPEDYAAAQAASQGQGYLREQLVKTAESFIGTPYRWGGTSSQEGFDCSGLTMTVYRLNGLDLVRISKSQYQTGQAVEKGRLQEGDLVFFATGSSGQVSHVGIFIGQDRFIHAASSGKSVKVDTMSGSYYVKRYKGGRSYL